MLNTNKIPEKLHSVIAGQWQEAINTDTPTEWSYTSGVLAGFIAHDSANHELMFLHQIATQRGLMAAKGSTSTYATLTPTARKMELIDVLARMKSHSITLSQFFCRLKTKRDAMAAMESEIANFQELIALVRLDVASEIDAMLKEVQP
jgi:hypothetical protein